MGRNWKVNYFLLWHSCINDTASLKTVTMLIMSYFQVPAGHRSFGAFFKLSLSLTKDSIIAFLHIYPALRKFLLLEFLCLTKISHVLCFIHSLISHFYVFAFLLFPSARTLTSMSSLCLFFWVSKCIFFCFSSPDTSYVTLSNSGPFLRWGLEYLRHQRCCFSVTGSGLRATWLLS